MEKTKEKLREEFKEFLIQQIKNYNPSTDDAPYLEITDWWLNKLDPYADAKIDKMFNEEANRGGGMIKVRGGNGLTLITKEQLAELDKNNV